MKKLSIIALFPAILFLSSGCATVFGRWGNSLVLENGTGQTAEVYLDGEKVGDAPGKIKLDARRIQQGSLLELRSEGHPPQEITLLRRVHPWYTLFNIVATAGVGMAVDFGTGYIYRPSPRKFSYDFPDEEN